MYNKSSKIFAFHIFGLKCCLHSYIPCERCPRRHLRKNCTHLIASLYLGMYKIIISWNLEFGYLDIFKAFVLGLISSKCTYIIWPNWRFSKDICTTENQILNILGLTEMSRYFNFNITLLFLNLLSALN